MGDEVSVTFFFGFSGAFSDAQPDLCTDRELAELEERLIRKHLRIT